MGQFNVNVTAVGGHGCQREIKDGQEVKGCGQSNCPDCIARDFYKKLCEIGCSVESATLIHWPGTSTEVVDDLITRIRKGNF